MTSQGVFWNMRLPGKSRENMVIGDPTSGVQRLVGINKVPKMFSLLMKTACVHIVLEIVCILPLGFFPLQME